MAGVSRGRALESPVKINDGDDSVFVLQRMRIKSLSLSLRKKLQALGRATPSVFWSRFTTKQEPCIGRGVGACSFRRSSAGCSRQLLIYEVPFNINPHCGGYRMGGLVGRAILASGQRCA
ncbi:unnamed protein product [Amoebophrya sp. A120]|nr:unnamed protein product [Amoebophrya sp. A120]|eukprot:GSA120T00011534001.1